MNPQTENRKPNLPGAAGTGARRASAENRGSQIRRVAWFLLRHGDKVSAVVLLVAFAAFLAASLLLPLGRLSEPGAGLWPSAVSVLGLLASAVLLFVGRDVPVLSRDRTGIRFLLYLVCIAVYPLFYLFLGFIPSTVVILIVLIRFAGAFGWIKAIVTSVIGTFAVYGIFAMALELPIDAF